MASISIRNLDDQIYAHLKRQASAHGRSMEEEVRQILAAAIAPPERLGDLFVAEFGAQQGVELELPERQPHTQPPSFE